MNDKVIQCDLPSLMLSVDGPNQSLKILFLSAKEDDYPKSEFW